MIFLPGSLLRTNNKGSDNSIWLTCNFQILIFDYLLHVHGIYFWNSITFLQTKLVKKFGNFCKKAVLLKDEVIFDLQLRRHLNLFSRLGALTGGLESTSAHVDPRRTHVAPIGPSWTPPWNPPGWNRGRSTKSTADSTWVGRSQFHKSTRMVVRRGVPSPWTPPQTGSRAPLRTHF